MSTFTAPARPPLVAHGHRHIIERTITVTRELVIDSGHETLTAAGIDRLVLRLALWLIERRRIRSLRPRVDSAEMSSRVTAGRQRHLDRYHGLPF